MKKCWLTLLLGVLSQAGFAQSRPNDLLLVGTFHFNNPGADLAKVKTLDITTPANQAALEVMATRIAAFRPTKIFVEWPYDEQPELDSLYAAYLGDHYPQYVATRYAKVKNKGFYTQNELVQLAFRAGKRAGLTKVYALDYNHTSFPADSVLKGMRAAHQDELVRQLEATIKAFETESNQNQAIYSLPHLLLAMNTGPSLTANKRLYLDVFNRAGEARNFAGAFLVAEWYRRNLYMYSLVQKAMSGGGKAFVLVGAGHAAMMREFIALDTQMRLVELKTVLGQAAAAR